MAVTFYPHEDDVLHANISEKLDVMMGAAERYKVAVLDPKNAPEMQVSEDGKSRVMPREIKIAFNWQEIAKLLREIHETPESNQSSRLTKAGHLTKLAEVYDVLRGAKMPKLDSVRLALVKEAAILQGVGA